MLAFKIIMIIFTFIGMNYLAYKIDKEGKVTTYTALCMGGITCLAVLLGLMIGLIFTQNINN